MAGAATPTAWATRSGAWRASRSASRAASGGAAARRSRRITWAIASASNPSVPGAAATHSSAFIPVSESRGPTNTNRAMAAPVPAGTARARAKACWKPTGESHVSRKSAPNETMWRAAAKSYHGTARVPNVKRFPSRSASNPNGSYTTCRAPMRRLHSPTSSPNDPVSSPVTTAIPLPRASPSFARSRASASSQVSVCQAQRGRDPVGVVEALERRLAPRAQPAPVHRRFGVALELDDAALAHLGVQPAARRALAAGGGVVGGDPRHLVLGRDHVGNELLGRLGPDVARGQRRGAAARRPEHREEPSAIHGPAPQ